MKLNAGKVVLDIQVSNYLIALIIFCSCSSSKKSVTIYKKQNVQEINYALNEAHRLYLFGNYNQAAEIYKSCILADDSCSVGFFQLANIETLSKNFNAALNYSIKANNIDNSNIWYKNQLIELLKYSTKYDTLKYIYPNLITKFPDKIEYRFGYALVLLENNKEDQAFNQLDSIELIAGSTENVSYLKSKIFLNKKDYITAKKYTVELLSLDSSNYQYLNQYAIIESNLLKYSQADSIYKLNIKYNLISHNVINDYVKFLITTKYSSPSFYVSNFLNDSINIDIKRNFIVDCLSDTITLSDSSSINSIENFLKANTSFPDYQIFLADINIKQKRYNEAIGYIEQYIIKGNANNEVYAQLFTLYNIVGNFSKMYELTGKLLNSKYPKDNLGFYRIISCYQLGKYRETINAISIQDVKNEKLKITYLEILSEVYFKIGNEDSTIWACEQILALDNNNYSLKNNYAYYLSVYKKSLPKAEKLIVDVLKQFPDNSTYLDTYAWILFQMNKFDKAKVYIDLALSKGGGGNPEILDHAGDIYNVLDDSKTAVVFWKLSYNLTKNPSTLEKLKIYEK